MEEAENAIKNLWLLENGAEIDVKIEEDVLNYLLKEGLVETDEKGVSLTQKGRERAERIIRLHRLAERLLNDVLGMAEKQVEESACRFEHFLDDDVEEAICTLLGHPSVCPHGEPIPKGKCCLKGEQEVERIIFRLSELAPGERAEIRYIVGGREVQSKTIAFGLLPGEKLRVIRVFPTFVIQVGNTQFALDRTLADSIYVLKSHEGEDHKEKEKRGFFRWRKGRGWR
jgi:DtxR family Mn-dependent transcriptional regulator